jgi:undecaprenyl-diphosphatase
MLQFLVKLDTQVFYFINLGIKNGFLDFLMKLVTAQRTLQILLILILLLLIIFEKKKGIILGIFLLLTIAISDQLSSHLIKPWVQRIRPCNVLPDVHLLVGCTKSFSFPSTHASNLFASAYFISNFSKTFAPVLYFMAVLVALSRVYVGVHYPLDIMGGALLGVFCAGLAIILVKWIDNKTTWLGREKLIKE